MRLIVLIAAVALTGCVTTDNQYGSGPLPPFSTELQRDVKEYFGKAEFDRAIAISADGRYWGRAWCNRPGSSLQRCTGVESMALGQCEKAAKAKCFLYAVDDQVVWKDAKVPAVAVSPAAPPTSPSGAMAVPAGKRDYLIALEIAGARYTGSASAESGSGIESFAVDTPEGPCTGAISVHSGRGTWSASCQNGIYAAGHITAATQNGSSGEGRDSRGRAVRFTALRK